ncbi:glycosyltransferase family 4 protein [Pandoraea anhela]|uniref:Glycosyl transferase family 1 n=1 Tax=Pandoraea anhela TaxID=2508295 RepID=A0A5E4Y550_9BURK|nr:glycosyltransferase family 4 protein [Pandoraea anhela]VVE43821.1 glycosyl transferase family 1 [Pandoraea anhela]
MKILYTNFHVGCGGGQDTYVRELARAMSCEHQITVATPPGSWLGEQVRRLPGVTAVEIDFKPRWHSFLRETLRLRRLIRESHFDVVHVNGSPDHRQVMLAVAGLARRPEIVFTKHNTYRANSLGNRLRARFGTSRTIAVSDFVRSMLERESSYPNIVVVKHGVHAPRTEPLGEDERLRRRAALLGARGDDSIVLGSAAGTGAAKGWADLVMALTLLPEPTRRRFRVWLAGTDPSMAQRAMVEQCGLDAQILFTGSINHVHHLLAVTDVAFVLSYHESLSYACREAMAAGCASLVTNVGGLPENVTPWVDGWIVPPRDPQSIAHVLMYIADKPERLRHMGHMARRKGQHEFDFDDFVAATHAVYVDAVSSRSSRASSAPTVPVRRSVQRSHSSERRADNQIA